MKYGPFDKKKFMQVQKGTPALKPDKRPVLLVIPKEDGSHTLFMCKAPTQVRKACKDMAAETGEKIDFKKCGWGTVTWKKDSKELVFSQLGGKLKKIDKVCRLAFREAGIKARMVLGEAPEPVSGR